MPLTVQISVRTPSLEGIIAQDAYLAYRYSKEILKKRWRRGESTILKDPYLSMKYARDVLKKRWRNAEKIISTCPESSFIYARDVVGGRWIEGENAVLKPWNFQGRYIIRKKKDIYLDDSMLKVLERNPNYPMKNEDIFHFAREYYKTILKKHPESVKNEFLKKWAKQLVRYPKAESLCIYYPRKGKLPTTLHTLAVMLSLSPHDAYEKRILKYYFRNIEEEAAKKNAEEPVEVA